MINRRFVDCVSCPARKSSKQPLAIKPRIHSPASGIGGHESGTTARPNCSMLELVDLPRGQMLSRPNQLIDYVYFPQEGMVSLVLQLDEASVSEARLG